MRLYERSQEEIIKIYGEPWSIESKSTEAFLKDMKEAWQQTGQTLHRWVHLTMEGMPSVVAV